MRRGSAFTIIEIIVTIAVLSIGILVITSSFSMNLRQSAQTREELLAAVVMESLVEEVLDHPFGAPAPNNWRSGKVVFEEVVEGRSVQTEFEVEVEASAKGGNGSFFGHQNDSEASPSSDVVTLQVRWQQPTGPGNSAQSKTLSADLKVVRKP